jgi:hypothetical protein
MTGRSGGGLWLALAAIAMTLSACCGIAHAQESGLLLAASGVSEIEGASGGELVPWAVVSGYGTRDAVGANLHGTFVSVPDFTLASTDASVGLYDRVELSYAHMNGSTPARQAAGLAWATASSSISTSPASSSACSAMRSMTRIAGGRRSRRACNSRPRINTRS